MTELPPDNILGARNELLDGIIYAFEQLQEDVNYLLEEDAILLAHHCYANVRVSLALLIAKSGESDTKN
jgi:hypothetical protein